MRILNFTNRRYYIVRAEHYKSEKIIKSLKNNSNNVKIHFNKYGEHNLEYPWRFIVSIPKTETYIEDLLFYLCKTRKWFDCRQIVPRQCLPLTFNSRFINETEVYKRREKC